jgi:hypothetical protein
MQYHANKHPSNVNINTNKRHLKSRPPSNVNINTNKRDLKSRPPSNVNINANNVQRSIKSSLKPSLNYKESLNVNIDTNNQNLALKNKQPPNILKKSNKPISNNNYNIIKPISLSLILGAIFIILNIFILIIFSNNSTINNIIISFIGVFIVIFLFLICIIYIIVLNGKKIKNALKIIAIIMAITFGITLILLVFSVNGKYPFINVFENSVGYLFCSLIYGNSLNKLFKFKENLFNNTEQFQPNKTVLLTLFTLENFDNLYNTFLNKDNNYSFTIDNSDISIIGSNDQDKLEQYLKGIVSYKNTIGILSWFYITSFFTTLISIKYLSVV